MLILASASPRRQELLKLITNSFTIKEANILENAGDRLPKDLVEYLAFEKAKKVLEENRKAIVIGADTIVVISGEVLGKPLNETDAKRMLKKLSGNWHQVCTGVAILSETVSEVFSVSTNVKFMKLDQQEIENYIATKEPFDKAGAYGIQGYGSKFVEKIEGDYFNVVGLPVQELYVRLKKWLPLG